MATYQSARVASSTNALTAVPARGGVGLVEDYASFTVSTALAVSDVIQMIPVASGATIVALTISCGDLDTNGTPTIVLDVGDGSDTDRFIDGSTIGQAGGLDRLGTHGGHLYEYTTADTIDILVETGPATGATSVTIDMSVIFSFANLV